MQNLDKFRERHVGKRIAILGTSPTLNLYSGIEEIAIGVNGSVMVHHLKESDYFVCGDKNSPIRKWFEISKKSKATRVIPTFLAPFDEIVLENPQERKTYQEQLSKDPEHQGTKHNIRFSPEFRSVREPHGIFDYSDIHEQKISPEQNTFVRGGTITGVAAQLAMLMGASEIHLYGCSFGTPDKQLQNHYSYDTGGEAGGVSVRQKIRMDYILLNIAYQEIKIFTHGFSNLEIPQKIDKNIYPEGKSSATMAYR